jgi:hypothetical protein
MQGIRKLNRGHRNNSFDRAKSLGVASLPSSHIGSSRIFFFNCREYGRGAPRCSADLRFGERFFLKQGRVVGRGRFDGNPVGEAGGMPMSCSEN